MPALPVPFVTTGHLTLSDPVTALARDADLRLGGAALLALFLVSSSVVLPGYPVRDLASRSLSAGDVRTILGVAAPSVSAVPSVPHRREPPDWNHLPRFGFIALGSALILEPRA